MTQVQLHRVLWVVSRAVLPFARPRVRYRLTLDASLWLDGALWPIRDPRGWWSFRRKYGRLLRACRRYGFCIEA